MLQNEDQRILSWSADGSRFQVYDVPRLETEVLRKYFKHDKFSSFQRQLNNSLSALVSQMKLKQKAVTTTTATPMEPSTSMKRPRSLLETSTTQHTALAKKPKMSPRDVCAVTSCRHELRVILEPLWLLEDDICSSKDDLLLLDALDLLS
ncbi:Heat shock transcription factor family [Phytophthora cactorum]|nr:Heat shock transcription factor family [Phytophthora cactorum]